MSAMNTSNEQQSSTIMEVDNSPAFVFQPQKLTEIVSMIDLMGSISERVREDASGDMGGSSGGAAATQGAGSKSASARDIALANLPMPQVMQGKLIGHIRGEIKTLDRQIGSIARSNAKGSAYMLSELYKKIRRLSSLIDEILQASADMVRRFYVAVFVDKQPILVSRQ